MTEMVRMRRCDWCESEFLIRDGNFGQSCCSVKCSREYVAHGNAPTRRQVQERIEHIAKQPKGAKTIAEFLSMGGRIYREAYGVRQ